MLVVNRTRQDDPTIAALEAERSLASALIERYYIGANRTAVSNTYFSLQETDTSLCEHPEVRAADVVNLHWVAGVAAPRAIRGILDTGKRVVWTLHDARPLTGGCHFPAGCDGFVRDCGSCPQLESDPEHLPAAQLREAVDCLASSPWTIVTPSKWLAGLASASRFAPGRRIEVIPYGIDHAVFRKIDRADACNDLGIARSRTYLCVGAHDLNEKRKGLDVVRATLQELAKREAAGGPIARGEWRVLCFGRDTAKLEHCGWQLEAFSYVNSDERLAAIYSAATAMLFCSSEDNLPNTIIEAMSCGCPVVASAAGGAQELVEPGASGFLAPVGDAAQLAKHVVWLMSDRIRAAEIGLRGRQKVCDELTLGAQAGRYMDIYQSRDNPQPGPPPALPAAANDMPSREALLLRSLESADREILRYEKEVIPAYEAKYKWLEEQVRHWRARTPGHWLRSVRDAFANTYDLLVREKMPPDALVMRWILLLFAKRPRRIGVLRQYAPRPILHDRIPRASAPDESLPSLSIVTPSFNQGDYIGRTVGSILSQDYPKLEYVVADGGSTDATLDVLRAHESPQIKWFSERDRGQADAIGKGFARSSGEIMAWVNSDDALAPGTLRYVGGYFAAHPEVDVVYGHRIIIDEKDSEIGRWILPKYRAKYLSYFDFVPQETLFWRRSAYEKCGGIDTAFHFALDWDLLLRFRSTGAKIVRLPYFMGCFRVHDEQKTSAQIRSVGKQEMDRLKKREGSDTTPLRIKNRLMVSELLASLLSEGLMRCGLRSTFF